MLDTSLAETEWAAPRIRTYVASRSEHLAKNEALDLDLPNTQAPKSQQKHLGLSVLSSCITDVVYLVQDEAVPRPETREEPMKRRTLDIIFSVGGLVLALLLLILGLVLQNRSELAEDYVHDQLAAQRITFTPADNLSDEEKKSSCLVNTRPTS